MRVVLGEVEALVTGRERVRVAGPPLVGRLVVFAGLGGLGLVRAKLRVDIG